MRELSGAEKQKESLRGLLGAATVLFRQYERLYVQFEEPISLRRIAAERLGAGAATLAVDDAWGGEAERPGAPARGGHAAAEGSALSSRRSRTGSRTASAAR